MGWGKLRKVEDRDAFHRALDSGTVEEFEVVYKPSLANYRGFTGATPLSLALSNGDPATRVTIATRLLDDGADVHQMSPLHVMLAASKHDFPLEAPLLRRLLDMGADVNEVYPRYGTPVETAAGEFKYTDADLKPFYDVLLARPDIDLLQPGMDGRPVLINLRKMYARRGELVERCEALLIERGIPVPGPDTEAP